MIKVIKLILLMLVLIGSTAWAVLVIYYGDSQSTTGQTCAAAIVGLYGLSALVGLGFVHWRKRLLAAYSVVFVVVVAWWWFAITPSNERQWQPDLALLPYATVEGDKVTVHNIRNVDYRSEFDFTTVYYDKTYDLTQLVGLDLFAVYWMGPAIAHTIMSFNFGDKDYLAVSIEVRKEQNEGYSTVKGFFRQYELTYIVADERDVIRLRTNYRNNPPESVYLYRLKAKPENIRRLFLEYIKNINELHDTPAFYNTLLDNCTTAIWFNTRVNPGHLPFSWKLLLSGYVPDYLYESKSLNNEISFDELQRIAYINPIAQAADQSPEFSRLIRAGNERPLLQ
jgi:Domain of unknown function (DUF4105)